jgi:hypothetical protein
MKQYTILLICLLNAAASDDFEAYTQEIAQEYASYYEKEMKAFKSFVETSDGIPNKVNPYQTLNILPPPPLSVPKTPPVTPEPPKVVPPPAPPAVSIPVVQKPPKEVKIPPKAIVQPSVPASVPIPVAKPIAEVLVKPKNTIPAGTPSGSQIKTVKIADIDVKKLVKIDPAPVALVPSIVSPSTITLSFFGASMPIEQSAVAFSQKLRSTDDISQLAQSIHAQNAPLIAKLKTLSASHQLNDWDQIILVQTLMNTLYPKNEHKLKTLHAIDLIRGLGFNALLGEGEDKKLYLLLPTRQQLFSKSYVTRNGIKYYIFSIHDHPRADFRTGIRFYTSEYDTQGSAIDMRMLKDPKLAADLKEVELKWDFEKKNYAMRVGVNTHLSALMDMYPQVDNEIYMQSRSGNRLITDMSEKLKKEIAANRFSEEKSVAFILRFAQQAFTYKTDFEAYGFERPLFVEQTILLPYSDCEDRATLLSQLYRATLGIDSVGLKYPGHISLGVAYRGKGDYYPYENNNYFVADGTYFYANPGVSQPTFKNKPATFLKTK